MFRQIWVNEDDSKFQKIVWRTSPQDELKSYQLLTVTYGTASAPFLATQTLNQLAEDYTSDYPEAAEVLKTDFYVDDLMSGASNLEIAQRNIQQLICLLKKGGFHLRKWASNNDQLMRTIPEIDRGMDVKGFESDSQTISILGVKYIPRDDVFIFNVKLKETVMTKRNMLSEASSIFDPIGWLAPATVKIKILFQKLWLLGVDWDQPLPSLISDSYSAVRNQLQTLKDLRIPRWIHYEEEEIELHGFADASELAYAAVIYSRVRTPNGYKVTIITAKTKVAPIKGDQYSTPGIMRCSVVDKANGIGTENIYEAKNKELPTVD